MIGETRGNVPGAKLKLMSWLKFWESEQLLKSLVIDSEGRLVGYVGRLVAEPRELGLLVYKSRDEKVSVVDSDALRNFLITFLTRRKFIGRANLEDLKKELKREMGMDEIGDRAMVGYAMKMNLEIPRKEVVQTVEDEIGKVSWSDILSIGETEMGVCILLKKPFFNSQNKFEEDPAFLPADEVKDKQVVDSAGRILGVAADILYSVEGPGLKIVKRSPHTSYIPDLNELEDALITTYAYRDNLVDMITKTLQVNRERAMEPDTLLAFARRTGLQIPMKKVVVNEDSENHLIVPWKDIRKMGEVVLLRKSIEELQGHSMSYS